MMAREIQDLVLNDRGHCGKNVEQPCEDQDFIGERVIDNEQVMPKSGKYEDTLRSISLS